MPLNPINLFMGELFNVGQIFLIATCHDGQSCARFACTASAANAMHIIFRMRRQIKIKDMADIRNIKTARGDIRADQKTDFARFEGFERDHAGALVHIAMQSTSREAMFGERFMQNGDIALAIAEDDRIFEILSLAQQLAQSFPLEPAIMGGHQTLRNILR